jgi:hypothetical protein
MFPGMILSLTVLYKMASKHLGVIGHAKLTYLLLLEDFKTSLVHFKDCKTDSLRGLQKRSKFVSHDFID